MSERNELHSANSQELLQVSGGISYSEAFVSPAQRYAQQIEAKFDPSRLKYKIDFVIPPRPYGR